MTGITDRRAILGEASAIWLEPFAGDASMLMLASPNGSSLPPADFTANLMIGGAKHAVTFAFSGGIKGQKLYRAAAIGSACDECQPSPVRRLLFSVPRLEGI